MDNIRNNKNKNTKSKIAVGLSGGVDSSVVAYLLKEQGHDVTGVFMQCWDAKADGCRADDDRADAVAVAAKLGIKFVSLDFVKEYKERVIEYFYREYESGRTPNPDVMCNKEIKFGLFLDWAVKEGFDYVATGHYAQVKHVADEYKLLMGVDATKDQSYFLYLLGQEQLAKTLFPLGELRKDEVRQIAQQVGLHTFDKPDSVGICFIGEVDIKEFLKKRLIPRSGNVINTKGEVIGKHDGVVFYTIGQRHGFEITKYVGLPVYVIGKNAERNELLVGFAKEGDRASFTVDNVHWVGSTPKMPLACEVRIRHLGELYSCVVSEGDGGMLTVTLEEPIFGVASGQSAVFYDKKELLGGGIIG